MNINYDLLKVSYDYRHKFLVSKEWKNLSALKKYNDPFCEICLKENKMVWVIDIDHIKSIKEYPELCLEYNNLQSLCKSCHSQKTQEELFNHIFIKNSKKQKPYSSGPDLWK